MSINTPIFEKVKVRSSYPFGMVMTDRQWSQYVGDRYRFGFNGMEKDDEVKGAGNSYDFGARIYDPRVARWFSLDPLFAKRPGTSPYVAFENNPIFFKDADGREVNPSPGFQESRYYSIYLRLASSNSAFQLMLAPFQRGHNAIFPDKLVQNIYYKEGKHRYATNTLTQSKNPYKYLVSNLDVYPSSSSLPTTYDAEKGEATSYYLTDLGAASILIHELYHSYLAAQGLPSSHNAMTSKEGREFFTNAIQEFAQEELGITLTPKQIETLYWDQVSDSDMAKKKFDTPEKKQKLRKDAEAIFYMAVTLDANGELVKIEGEEFNIETRQSSDENEEH